MSGAIKIIDLHKSFGPAEIIRGIDLEINAGERHAIIGPNGAGKSTLFHLISGRYEPTAGNIQLNDVDISGLPPYEIFRKGLSRSFQVTNIFPRLTVYENIRCAILWVADYKYSFWHKVEDLDDVNEQTEKILEQIGLDERAFVPAGLLAYAEQRALEIGVAIASGNDVILLDEPTAGMSHSETEQAVELIRNVTKGKTLVMVEHDMGVIFNLADRISVMVYGQIIATDTPENIRNNAAVQEAYLGTEIEDD